MIEARAFVIVLLTNIIGSSTLELNIGTNPEPIAQLYPTQKTHIEVSPERQSEVLSPTNYKFVVDLETELPVDFVKVENHSLNKILPRLRTRSSGSSSSPVEPIRPLLNLGSQGVPEDEGVSLPPNPMFDQSTPTNVSALQDNSAYLHCLVHSLGNKSVSWIRQRDLHILTVDRYTYTTDQRYEVIHSDGSQDWILKIKYAQLRDSGRYDCQISTKPIRSYSVYLNVYAAPKAHIIGAPDLHVNQGSTINLTCVIDHTHQPPAYIFWYHNGDVVNYDSPRGGITVVTERGHSTTGYLLIQDAKVPDSGNYSCKPSNTAATFIGVHVLSGEIPAAMQTSGGEVKPHNYVHFICFLFVLYSFLHRFDINYFYYKET